MRLKSIDDCCSRITIANIYIAVFCFNSVKQGLLIYSAIPLSAIGGIFFLALRGMPFISAGIDLLCLVLQY
jgi:cobalt-zinc-cadmium resistance protein CzcA